MLKPLLLSCVSSVMFAAVHGTPEPVFPGPSPGMWMDLGNDNFIPHQPDDRLTASWAVGARDGDWLIGGEYDMLTSKATKTRQDELTGSLGIILVEESGYRFSTSVGFRNYHGISGQDLQNYDHRRTGDPTLDLKYDDNVLTGVWMCDFRQTKTYTVGDKIAGYFWVAEDAITSRANEFEAWGGPCLDITQHDTLPSFLWVGAGFRGYTGGYFGKTDEVVEKAYAGWSFRGGIRLQGLSATLTVGSHAAYGTIGFCF